MGSGSSAPTITPPALSRILEEYLATVSAATVLEDGAPLFDLAQGHYSVSESSSKCLLHLWSEERNLVRRVLDAERKAGSLVLSVMRFGKTNPTQLEFLRRHPQGTQFLCGEPGKPLRGEEFVKAEAERTCERDDLVDRSQCQAMHAGEHRFDFAAMDSGLAG